MSARDKRITVQAIVFGLSMFCMGFVIAGAIAGFSTVALLAPLAVACVCAFWLNLFSDAWVDQAGEALDRQMPHFTSSAGHPNVKVRVEARGLKSAKQAVDALAAERKARRVDR